VAWLNVQKEIKSCRLQEHVTNLIGSAGGPNQEGEEQDAAPYRLSARNP